MLISQAFPLTYDRKPAQMRVLRNDGYCWGRLITADGAQLDVATARDHYDDCDEDAAASFIRAAKRKPRAGRANYVEPAYTRI